MCWRCFAGRKKKRRRNVTRGRRVRSLSDRLARKLGAQLACESARPLARDLAPYSKQLLHFVVEKAFAGLVGLHPLSVEDELRDGALARALHHFIGGAGDRFDVDLFELDVVLREPALGLAAVGTPGSGIDSQVHRKQSAISDKQ